MQTATMIRAIPGFNWILNVARAVVDYSVSVIFSSTRLISGRSELERLLDVYIHTADCQSFSSSYCVIYVAEIESGNGKRKLALLNIVNELERSYSEYLQKINGDVEDEEVYRSIAQRIAFECKFVSQKSSAAFCETIVLILERLNSLSGALRELRILRDTSFNNDSPVHNALLESLWSNLKPFIRIEARYTKQWGEIGFQGKDPASDLRGMGVLGLMQLEYFSKHWNNAALRIVDWADDDFEGRGFPMAITGINVSAILLDSTLKRELDGFYVCLGDDMMENFHELYSGLFFELCSGYVASKPKNIFDFSPFYLYRYSRRFTFSNSQSVLKKFKADLKPTLRTLINVGLRSVNEELIQVRNVTATLIHTKGD